MWYGADYATDHYNVDEWNQTPLSSGIATDIQTLAEHFSIVRTYALNMWTTPAIINAAYCNGIRVVLEIPWVSGQTSDNSGNYEYFQYLVTRYTWLQDAIAMILIGNENMPTTVAESDGLLAQRSAVETWISSHWGSGTKPKVGLSEQNGVWLGDSGTPGYHVLSQLPAGTPVLSNIYPYWGDLTVAQATDSSNSGSLAKQWSDLVTHAGTVNTNGVDLYVGETGWPTAGTACSGTTTTQTPSEADSVTYWTYVFNTWTPKSCNGILSFEAFDEPNKRNTACPGSTFPAHWGLWSSSDSPAASRSLKTNMPLPSNTTTTRGSAGTPVNVITMAQVDNAKLTVNVYYPSDSSTAVAFPYPAWYTDASAPFQGYPFITEGSKVELVYDGQTVCHNTLTGGDGVGPASALNLTWQNPNSASPPLSVNWANNGIWIGMS